MGQSMAHAIDGSNRLTDAGNALTALGDPVLAERILVAAQRKARAERA
jgi:hypothetical protein